MLNSALLRVQEVIGEETLGVCCVLRGRGREASVVLGAGGCASVHLHGLRSRGDGRVNAFGLHLASQVAQASIGREFR